MNAVAGRLGSWAKFIASHLMVGFFKRGRLVQSSGLGRVGEAGGEEDDAVGEEELGVGRLPAQYQINVLVSHHTN